MAMAVKLLNLEEAAAFLNLEPGKVRQMAVCGEIPCIDSGSRLTFEREELDNWYTNRLIRHLPVTPLRRGQRPSGGTDIAGLCHSRIMTPSLGGKTRDAVLRALTELCENSGALYDPREFYEELRRREDVASTAMKGGIALCHPENRDEFLCEKPFIAVAHTEKPVFFGDPDGGTTDLFFVIAGPDDDMHLQIMAQLCALLENSPLAEKLRGASTAEAMLEAVVECTASSRQ